MARLLAFGWMVAALGVVFVGGTLRAQDAARADEARFDPDAIEFLRVHGLMPMTTGSTIGRMVAHPDGKRLLTSCQDHATRVWDIATGEELQRFEHKASTWAVAVHPAGKRMLSGGHDEKLTMWDLDTEALLWEVDVASRPYDAAFHPNGKWFASRDEKKTVAIREVQTGEVLSTIEGFKQAIYCLRWLDANHLITGADNGEVMTWALSGLEVVSSNRVTLGNSHDVYSLDVHPVKPWAAAAIDNEVVRVYNQKAEVVWEVKTDGEPRTPTWNSDGTRLAVVATNGKLAMYDFASTNELWKVSVGTKGSSRWTAEFSQDDTVVFVADENQVLRFAAADGSRLDDVLITRTPRSPSAIALGLGADKNAVAVISDLGEQRLDLISGTFSEPRFADGEKFAFSPDGKLLAVAKDDAVRLIDRESGDVLSRFESGAGDVRSLKVLDGGRVLMNTSSGSARLHFWDAEAASARRLWTSGVGTSLTLGGGFDAGQRVCFGLGGERSGVVVLDARDGSELQKLSFQRRYIRSVATSPKGVMAFAEESSNRNQRFYHWRMPATRVELNEATIRQHIKSLGAERYKERKAAVEVLSKGGFVASSLLAEHVKSDDPEVRFRAVEAMDLILKRSNLPLKAASYQPEDKIEVKQVVLHPDGTHWFVIAGEGVQAEIWIGRTTGGEMEVLRKLRKGHGPAAMTLGLDGTLYVANFNGSVSVWGAQ